jgi:CDGSH-type Zn-finger protein
MDNPTVTIRLREHGPLVVNLDGGVTVRVIDHLGQAFTLPTHKPTVALCRCGQSNNKPFCDGAHKACGFQASETVPPLLPDPAPPAQTA